MAINTRPNHSAGTVMTNVKKKKNKDKKPGDENKPKPKLTIASVGAVSKDDDLGPGDTKKPGNKPNDKTEKPKPNDKTEKPKPNDKTEKPKPNGKEESLLDKLEKVKKDKNNKTVTLTDEEIDLLIKFIKTKEYFDKL